MYSGCYRRRWNEFAETEQGVHESISNLPVGEIRPLDAVIDCVVHIQHEGSHLLTSATRSSIIVCVEGAHPASCGATLDDRGRQVSGRYRNVRQRPMGSNRDHTLRLRLRPGEPTCRMTLKASDSYHDGREILLPGVWTCELLLWRRKTRETISRSSSFRIFKSRMGP